MNKDDIRKAVYDKYIKPSERPGTHRAGVELEFPVYALSGGPVDFSVVHALTEAVDAEFGFTERQYDDDGNIFSARVKDTEDNISYDCSYNTIEFSFGVDHSLCDTWDRFSTYYEFIQKFLLKAGHTLTGMGINPGYKVNINEPVPNGRYRMLLHHLESYKRYIYDNNFHRVPNFGLISCASQVQLDAEKDLLVEELNTFTKVEPFKALLFANSPYGDYLCARDYFWMNSLHGLNRRNVDILETRLHSIDDLVDYISTLSIYCVERGEKYINFRPTVLTDYFQRDYITGEYFDSREKCYKNMIFKPELSDISHLRSFKFEDVTYRGTIEFRSVCEQPASEAMTAAAFQTGLAECLPELTDYLENRCPVYRGYREPVDLRRLFVRKDFIKRLDEMSDNSDITELEDTAGPSVTKGQLTEVLSTLVAISDKGLRLRRYGEEKFLEPLYKRVSLILSPALEMMKGIEEGKSERYYIEKFASL